MQFIRYEKMSSVFVNAGPAEILRAVQKDTILVDLIEKQLSDLLIKSKGNLVRTKHTVHLH